MSEESKANQPNSPRKIIVEALTANILSNAEMSNEDKADACYKMILAAMSKFIPQSQLEARLLNEARALEQALGADAKNFDIVIWAKPKNQAKKGELVNESASTQSEPAQSESGAGTGSSAS